MVSDGVGITHSDEAKMTLIIAIGGARGTGKSALARMLSSTLRADVLHLGRVRSLLRAMPEHDPILQLSVNEAESVDESMKILRDQAELKRPMVEAAIQECEKRQASLIIEGAHCLPGLYPKADVQALLYVAETTIQARYGKDKIRGGIVSPAPEIYAKPIARNIAIQSCLMEELNSNRKTELVRADYLPSAFVKVIRLIPERSIPRFGTDT